ncbi:PREDICTED: conserved oligomeric Golgi complex subunit 2-like [Acropora digitifera]|uniref:conserved oligomeric Golgi complex subunit 2-like n=1 Tax=Acropora digitifera TaxID=70779 RepID=UPI00077AC846|nr:PREDICTED: conserved oligomeric Golgi complex subunit 2-like [Acropora digitifera]
MADTSIEEIVPREPETAVFSRSDFMKESFSVDVFVGNCKGNVQLDLLKANLDDYLKSLKHALIELINEDYADFVNLSTNLVGMDKNIFSLSVPLGQLKEEVLLIKSDLDGTVNAIETKLDERALLRKKKMCMQHLLNITKSLEKIERLMQGSRISQGGPSKELDRDDGSQLIERMASEFNQLQFYVTQSQGHPLVESIRGRIAAITSTLQKKLEAAFQEGLRTGELNLLSRVLRTYAIIDKTRDAEMLFREVTVKRFMNEVIVEKALADDPSQGLYNVYNKVLEFVPRHCTSLMNICSGRFVARDMEVFGEQRAGIRGFDFLVNAVWPEVVNLVETRFGSIFAPGNPDSFHQKYTTTMWFISKFEGLCGSKASVERLRSHPSFMSFLGRWSLPVYFQIRFQEMASKFETSLQSPQVSTAEQDSEQFMTCAVSVLWWCVQRCWQDSVFLQALCHRFWKLTLQVWKIVPEFFRQGILPRLRQSNIQDLDLLSEAILESCGVLQQLIPGLEGQIVSQVVNGASHGLDAAKNIPRLYRRTNKEVPTKASPFVNNVLRSVRDFLDQNQLYVSQSQRQAWAAAIMQTLLSKYRVITSDVLTSIKRTEDSLMRLKRSRKQLGSGSGGQGTNQEGQCVISDDDKIRLQFTLDTEEFGQAIKELGIDENRTPAYTELMSTVKNARTSNSALN